MEYSRVVSFWDHVLIFFVSFVVKGTLNSKYICLIARHFCLSVARVRASVLEDTWASKYISLKNCPFDITY